MQGIDRRNPFNVFVFFAEYLCKMIAYGQKIGN